MITDDDFLKVDMRVGWFLCWSQGMGLQSGAGFTRR